jgi:hypothetical protein
MFLYDVNGVSVHVPCVGFLAVRQSCVHFSMYSHSHIRTRWLILCSEH